MANTPEIEELKHIVEQTYGRVLGTSTDFDEFSLYVKRTKDLEVSASTLKRLWGYVHDVHKPRKGTLDQLSVYIGHASFNDFKQWLKTSIKYNSSFFNAQQLVSNDIKKNAVVTIGWNPNRVVTLRYLGDSLYEVVSTANSKFNVGDRFCTGCFIMNQPLFLPFIERAGEHTAPFVAGRNGGLTVISMNDN